MEKRYAGLDGRDDHMFVGFKSAVAVRFEVGACAVPDLVIRMLTAAHNVVEGLREVDAPGGFSTRLLLFLASSADRQLRTTRSEP